MPDDVSKGVVGIRKNHRNPIDRTVLPASSEHVLGGQPESTLWKELMMEVDLDGQLTADQGAFPAIVVRRIWNEVIAGQDFQCLPEMGIGHQQIDVASEPLAWALV